MVFSLNKIKDFFTSLKGLATIGSANGIAALISGVFWFYMAVLLGTEQYGRISYLVTIATMASIVASFGSTNTIITYTAKEQKIQTSVYFVVIILSIIASIAVFFLVNDIGVSLLVFGSATFLLGVSEHLGKKLYKDYSKYVIGQRILSVGLAAGLYFLMGPNGIILGFALSYFPFFIKLYRELRESKFEINSIKPRLGFITNSYALDLTHMLMTTTDKLIVYPLFGFALLGNYQLGMQVLTVLTVLPMSVFQYILPRQASGISVKNLVKVTVLVSIMLAILGIILAPKIIPLLFPKFRESIGIIQIIILAIIPTSIISIYTSKFFALERNRPVLIAYLLYFGVLVTTIFILGEHFGINGAASGPVFGATSAAVFLIIANKMVLKKQIK